tara:strand:- start:9554 stop:10240 length:687 start_codon:yes stop_codon:yes gene_type:complete
MSGVLEGAELRLVTPGEAIGASSGARAGSGVIIQNEKLIATKVGWVNEKNGVTSINPINSAYMPRSGDLVIGIVESVRNNLWFAEVNGPFNGLLPMSLAPWKVEFGAAREQMDIGDIMLARIQEVDEAHNIVLTMKGVGLRKLKEGIMEEIPINTIAHLRGENNSLLNKLKDASDCRIIVAENGRVWIDGEGNGISFVRSIIEKTRNSGHNSRFTENILEIIEERRSA